MDVKRLRKRCEERLQALPLPAPFDIHAFCNSVAQRRGHPIVLLAVPSGPGVTGAWLAGDDTDFIVYSEETTLLHQQHIVVHEVSHMLCGHKGVTLSPAELAQLLF